MMPASGPELNTPMTTVTPAFGGRPDVAPAGLDFPSLIINRYCAREVLA